MSSEPELQNGLQPEPHPQSPQPESPSHQQPQPELESGSEPKAEVEPVKTDVDLKSSEASQTSIHSNDADHARSTEPTSRPELRKDEGSRTFTMRELLNGLKSDSEPDKEDASSPYRFTFCCAIDVFLSHFLSLIYHLV